MALHSSTLAWKIPWREEPGGLQSMGLQRVVHNSVISLSLFTLMQGEGNGNPLQCSCLESPRDGGAWWAAIYGVTQSQTQLKWLSSSSITEIVYKNKGKQNLLSWPLFVLFLHQAVYLDFILLACHKLWCYNTDLHWDKLALGILIFGFLEDYYHIYNLRPPAASLYKQTFWNSHLEGSVPGETLFF